uniref:SET and MYND domain-containing protein 4 n=1 Tax=Culex tarsalis TaxID=7177 RepID=A0A1Q3EY08_CULTA
MNTDGFPENAIGIMLNRLVDMLGQGIQMPPVMTAYRDFVLNHEHLLNNVVEPVKSNTKAAQARQEGNRLYLARRYEKAFEKYNESICYAEAGSEQLAMGYANRSAIYYEQGEFEFALLNIRLATDHNYPEKLMPKLETREKNCRKKIDEGLAKDNVPCPRMGINVEVNPKIPFLAKGVGMKQYPGSGRGLVAERNFKTGDVILDEKTILSVVSVRYRYLNCSHCGISNQHSLIPCPNCVLYMYCSEECLAEDKRLNHRFECGFGAQTENVTVNGSNMAPKLFFHGLTLFNDDMEQMMKYCEKNAFAGSNPLLLDYTKPDPLEEFKMLHKAKLPCSPLCEYTFKLCAAVNYIFLLKQPAVQSLVTSEAQKEFFLNCLYHYQRISNYFSWEWNTPAVAVAIGLMTIGSLFNHSCDPNATIMYHSGRLKCVLIRPVREGDQITSSLGPCWFNPEAMPVSELSFKCRCPVCLNGHVRDWLKKGKPFPASAGNDLSLCMAVMVSETANEAAKLNAFQQIIQRYDHFLPNMDLSVHLRLYIERLEKAIMEENVKLNRAKVAAAVA